MHSLFFFFDIQLRNPKYLKHGNTKSVGLCAGKTVFAISKLKFIIFITNVYNFLGMSLPV